MLALLEARGSKLHRLAGRLVSSWRTRSLATSHVHVARSRVTVVPRLFNDPLAGLVPVVQLATRIGTAQFVGHFLFARIHTHTHIRLLALQQL